MDRRGLGDRLLQVPIAPAQQFTTSESSSRYQTPRRSFKSSILLRLAAGHHLDLFLCAILTTWEPFFRASTRPIYLNLRLMLLLYVSWE